MHVCMYTRAHACACAQVNFYEGPPFKFKGTAKSHERFPNCVRYSPDGEKFFSVGSDQVCAGRTACVPRTAAYNHRLSTEDRAAVLKRAKTGGLRTDLVLERARAGALFDAKEDGQRASCWDLTNLKIVDEKALQAELELLADLEKIVAESQTASLKKAMQTQQEKVALINLRLEETIAILKVEEAKRCDYDTPLSLKLYD